MVSFVEKLFIYPGIYKFLWEGTTTLPKEIAPRKNDPRSIFSLTKIENGRGVAASF